MRSIFTLLMLLPFIMAAQEFRGSDASSRLRGAELIRYKNSASIPDYVSFAKGSELSSIDFEAWLRSEFGFDNTLSLLELGVETDRSGIIHHRFRQLWNGIPIESATVITHEKNGLIQSWNGLLVESPMPVNPEFTISEGEAFRKALEFVGASEYRWQNNFWEQQIKATSSDSAATWLPKAEQMLISKEGQWYLVYRFDIYAQSPLSRQYVFVSVSDGSVLKTVDRLRNTDVPAIANTKYSGTQTITTDSVSAASYRLRETGRGLGIETYDLNNGTSTASAVDFFDNNNVWDIINAEQDEVATDAHWGAEMTYDYFFVNYGRNSIDNAGQKLISFVHYDYNWANAMWDGYGMYYGDGDAGQGITPLTTVDICGHEISHGLTENTAGLIYASESGALNESYSDIFGVSIRYYAKPSDFSWMIGDEMGWTIRNLANPNQFNQPDTYLGNYWDPYEEVHTNSGVMNFWFYLLSVGGSGTNDNGASYNVTAISIDSAAAIAYRTLTVYLIESSNYADARFYSIIAAADLFGPCSTEMIAATNAWHAVGVGAPFNSTVTADFSSADSLGCSAPHTVSFQNESQTAFDFIWDFGDGNSSTVSSPTHTYNALGQYTVTLIADGGVCGKDTTEKINYVDVDDENPCIILMPANGTGALQTSCYGVLMDSGGEGNYPDDATSTITISPVGAQQLTIIFSEFALEQGWDYLRVYDGSNVSAPLIGEYTGFSLPNGGTISSTGPSLTIRLESDIYINESGFKLTWHCITAVDDIAAEKPIVIFPNPVGSLLSVQLNNHFSGEMIYQILDVTGKVIVSKGEINQSETMVVNVEALSPGFYFLMMMSDTESQSIPFVRE